MKNKHKIKAMCTINDDDSFQCYYKLRIDLNRRCLKPNDNNYRGWLMVGYMADRAELIKWLQDTRYFESPLIRMIIRKQLNDVSNRLRELYRELA